MPDYRAFGTLSKSVLRRIYPDHVLSDLSLQVLQYGGSPYLQDLGLNVTATPMQIQGRILTTPTLQYKNGTCQPANGMWNMRDKKLYQPVAIKGCVMIIFDPRFKPNSEIEVKQGLFESCRALGITGMPNPGDIPVLRKDPANGQFTEVSIKSYSPF